MTPLAGFLTVVHLLIIVVYKITHIFKFGLKTNLLSKQLLSDDLDLEVLRAYPRFGFFPKFAKRIE